MKLVVAAVLLVAVATGAKVAVEHLAPEKVASASTQLAGPEGAKAGLVQAVRFTGSGLRAASFADVITTRVGEPLRAATLEADRLHIVAALTAAGHFDASVDAPNVRDGSGGAFVELRVDAGPRYVVREVRLEGNQARLHPELAAVATLRPGHDAVSDRISGNVELLRGWLAHRGVRATVTTSLEIDRYTQQVDVIFRAN